MFWCFNKTNSLKQTLTKLRDCWRYTVQVRRVPNGMYTRIYTEAYGKENKCFVFCTFQSKFYALPLRDSHNTINGFRLPFSYIIQNKKFNRNN